jgi:glycosyltransferase involved in cell wall biosynthesis
MIKVLQFLGSMGYGGVETWLMHVWRHIDRTKFQFDFCYTKPQPGAYAPEIESLGGRMVACRLDQRNPFGFARRFRALLRKGQYSVVHSHVHHFSGFVIRLAHRAGVPMRIAHSHSTSDGKGSGPSRILYHALMKHWIRKHATHGLAASGDAAVSLFGLNWQSDSRFRVVHCGIDLERFRQDVCRQAVRQELGIPLNALVVGHVGSFRPPKNHAFLLQIAAEVLKMRPDVRFLLVGDGPLRPQIEARARDLGIEKNVIFAGVRSDVPRLMLGAMDVFLFPSLWEGLGIVLVEAQAAGLRCVSSDVVPGQASVVPDAFNRFSLSANASTWATRVLQTVECGALPKEMALEVVAGSHFNIAKSCQSLAELYGSGMGVWRVDEKADA